LVANSNKDMRAEFLQREEAIPYYNKKQIVSKYEKD
jgi:hypothetical protein